MLHSLAMLVSHVARRFAPKRKTQTAECDGDQAIAPEAISVLGQYQEPQPAAASSQTIEALMATVLLVKRVFGFSRVCCV